MPWLFFLPIYLSREKNLILFGVFLSDYFLKWKQNQTNPVYYGLGHLIFFICIKMQHVKKQPALTSLQPFVTVKGQCPFVTYLFRKNLHIGTLTKFSPLFGHYTLPANNRAKTEGKKSHAPLGMGSNQLFKFSVSYHICCMINICNCEFFCLFVFGASLPPPPQDSSRERPCG